MSFIHFITANKIIKSLFFLAFSNEKIIKIVFLEVFHERFTQTPQLLIGINAFLQTA